MEDNCQFKHILLNHGFKKHGKSYCHHEFFKHPNGFYASLCAERRFISIDRHYSENKGTLFSYLSWISLVKFLAKNNIEYIGGK